MKVTRPLLAIVVPLLVMAIWTMRHVLVVSHGRVVELAIAGYDPRDLLSGHYLNYEVVYGSDICAVPKASNRETCVCLSLPRSDAPLSQVTWHGACAERQDCKAWLRGKCSGSRFQAGIERFYFSEQYTKELAVVPEGATIEVSLDGQGRGIVTGMKVAGEPLADFLMRQQSPETPSEP